MPKKWFSYGLYRAYGAENYATSNFFASEEELVEKVKDDAPNPFTVDLNWNMVDIYLHELSSDGKRIARMDILKQAFGDTNITTGLCDEVKK